ncbi:gp53 [Rhodococcus phage ReqiPine5]|uniref:Gp53 n=1 Tax=Rhodococcus phage ReqiPine5 TaxID=691963 RepID=D4P828_9CAUD|nr:gp53 [Rhodococcus phage ReqiPine5]ADD81158.1 gp53 [Rhodococcus phage ReqiPine5]
MTYTNPLNWVAMGDGYDALVSSDADLNLRVGIERRRTELGTWTVSVKLFNHPRFGADWSTELRADTYVRHTLLAHGFTEDQIATFEIPMDEPELLSTDTDLIDEGLGPEWREMSGWWVREYQGYRLEVDTWGERYKVRAISSPGAADEKTWTLAPTYENPVEAAGAGEDYVQRNPLTTGTDLIDEEPTPARGTVIDPDENIRLIQILAVHWETNHYGTRTMTVRAERGIRGLTVVAIEIPASVSAGESPSSQWTLVVRVDDWDAARETYTATATHMARIMRREYVRWSV